ncbi:MAG: tetratricopeptide repeat protein [Planctomycetes bacterium]|nr:tetratricopeptide repeat protein [Planctomycetota bacterium]
MVPVAVSRRLSRRWRRSGFAVFAGWARVAGAGSPARAADDSKEKIEDANGKVSEVYKITGMEVDRVSFVPQEGGVPIDRPRKEVRRVIRTRIDDSGLRKGLKELDDNRVDAAAQSLAKAADVKEGLDRQQAMYHLAVALARKGDAVKARAAYEAYLAAYGKGFYVPETYGALGEIALGANERPKALDFFTKLAAIDGFQELGKFWTAYVIFLDGKFPEAEPKFKEVCVSASFQKRFPAQYAVAACRYAQCLARAGKAEEAFKRFTDVINSPETPDVAVRAIARNGLGDYYFDKGNYAEARRHYLYNYVLYTSAQETMPHALCRAALCFRKLNESPEPKHPYNGVKRAENLEKELKEKFPNFSCK